MTKRVYIIELDRRGEYILRDSRSLIVICRSSGELDYTGDAWHYRFAATSSLVAVERAKQLVELARQGLLPPVESVDLT